MKTYPKGFDGRQTTKEEWDAYEIEKQRHDEHIKRRRDELTRNMWYLRHISRGKELWTLDEIEKAIASEISMSASCDAPNEPGYFRANND